MTKYYVSFMVLNSNSIKFFFFLSCFLTHGVFGLDVPEPISRPQIAQPKYSDVFDQIKKQNWVMAVNLANDYNIKSLSSYVKWLDITRPGSKHQFEYLSDFINKHPNWPKKKVIIEKIESSITKNTERKKIINWFKNNPPLTSKGSIDYLEAQIKEQSIFNKSEMIRDIWINKNLTSSQQKYFIRKYSNFWTQQDNWKRFNRLMVEGKEFSARKTLNRVKGDLRKLGEARLNLSRRSPNVSKYINDVPLHLIDDSDLVYERMRWRRKAKLNTASDLLINPPKKISNVRGWWINSRIVIRRLLNKKKFFRAYDILSKNTLPLTTDSGLEAEWLAGWVAFSHLNQSENAKKHFKKVFEYGGKNYKAKAAFWLGLIDIDNSQNNQLAVSWFKKSAINKFSYYGQNSSIKINNFSIKENKSRIVRPNDYNDLFEVIKIIHSSKKSFMRSYPFYEKLVTLLEKPEHINYVMELASNEKDKSIVLKLSKKLPNPSYKYSYPKIEDYIPDKYKNSKSTLALIHAISHQESNFKVNAYSSAGARGVMQLMPFTAKRVCKSLGIRFYKKKLTQNPQYNILLGTTYINQMLKKFDNALPLALAAYNAGPGRVRIWLKRYGDPRTKSISYLDWIESIPISETRYYVKKVISNLRIYQSKYNINIYL